MCLRDGNLLVSDYGLLDRLLHRLALQVAPISEMSFEIDQWRSGESHQQSSAGKHVFVSGLARAGTTILMRRIYASGTLSSLTYRNMPFVLAPNIWRPTATIKGAAGELKERAHGDRILVNADSPESLDEVFWRVFDSDAYLAADHLRPHEASAEITQKYASYVAAILKADHLGRTRYLSKNNNNILRLIALARQFPNAIFLIPFRDPRSQAASLHGQHRHFLAEQGRDAFIHNYMMWLGHHEFGRTHRPFRFDDKGRERLAELDSDNISYWLELWCQVYEWLLKTAPPSAHFVCYEALCRDPKVWKHIAEICSLPEEDASNERFEIVGSPPELDVAAELLARSDELYSCLVARGPSSV